MPELPEVETVKRGLAPVMEGARIVDAELRRPDLRFPFPAGFADALRGRTILSLGRRAKYLLIDLDGGDVIISHLGMSGSFRIDAQSGGTTPGDFHVPRGKDPRHDHVVLHLETADGPVRIIYNDPRRFGFMDLARRDTLSGHAFFRDLGEEPTGNALDARYLSTKFRGRSQPLKAALLDQKNIAGLGNIYVCEALWRAHLSPERAAGSLVTATGKPRKELVVLTEAIRAVIDEAIGAGGSTLRDHIRTDGSLGYFQHSFAVYDQEGAVCRTPGCGATIGRIVQAGRSTFYCAACQK
ncbi:bifunctional DNA-formamidopyrimidine glycosylase/DNA-(apurinic or apyrimidinic site) lyase [Sinorhizobium sp. BG8]|uniref:bifunctional DNA-formamidopyrimidine glycosylase/DNA-(apurinic or apyrimidinic site) lyase n=1 Tax=Sinorhizobium sp. BG8 TaxID=2613773 RepID=UPI00193D1C52|nr:bifunctional DNA-formamidopyrimidine glycosylase/DNA-(apurinic or apyrimidinic site) lyase [Sinorhizobium sp. BG8]QRM53999.1 bifunctional DNA-formamidopyrimidine glycosylase/DNA-(apurinic or apyrimidinic site) lyase [Sinorhizobium sp. BG8]